MLLLVQVVVGAGCAPTPPEPAYRIGFSQCTMGDDWRRAMLAGMEKELSFHPNVQFQMLDAHNDSELQCRQVEQLIAQRVDLLIISPNQSGPLTALAEAAYNQGIPVVVLDRRTTSRLYTAYVGGNNLEVGRTAGRYVAQLLHQRGQVLEVTGQPGSSPAADRANGFAQALAAFPGIRLMAQVAAARLLGLPANPDWALVAQNILILKMADGVTQEHTTYHGEGIKQGDVNLLVYPLNVITDPAQIRKDLAYYETRVPNEGTPAMTQGISALPYARLGNADKARLWFKDAYEPNLLPPFRVIAETKGGTNPYYATGAGGVLQAVLVGFGGLDITPAGITQRKSTLPTGWQSVKITGVGPQRRTYSVGQ